MDGFFGVLLFLVFVLAPIIEQIRKQQQGKQPPTRQPPSRLPQPRPTEIPQRSQTEEVSSKSRDAASVLIPDDLWTILTGEQRPPVLTLPEPAAPPRRKPMEVYIPPEEAADEEAVAPEDVNIEVARTSREAVRREHERRHKQVAVRVPASLEIEPRIVSLETGMPTGAARHTAFHEKLAQTAPAVAAKAGKRSLLNMSDPREIRRAFILQAVLGTPRGLE